jgi:hypothetical protein
MGQPSAVTRALDVAEAVWRAVNDPSCPVRVVAGADAIALAESYSKFKIGQDDVGMSGGRVVTSVAPGNLIKVPWLQPSE